MVSHPVRTLVPPWIWKAAALTAARAAIAPGGSRIRFSRVAVENALPAIHVAPVDPAGLREALFLSGQWTSARHIDSCPRMVLQTGIHYQ
jgi:hypothetical protein